MILTNKEIHIMERRLRFETIIVMVVLLICGALIAACNGMQQPEPEAEAEFNLTGVMWQWESMTVQGGETTTVPNPDVFTAIFNEDGTMGGTNDCNVYSGEYTVDGNNITITPGISTLAFCGEESLDTLFRESLAEMVSFGPDGSGGLAMTNPGGEKRMVFSDGGPPQ
jgi:heat shock protein HslJ